MNHLPIHELRASLTKLNTICTHCNKHPATDVHHINGIHHDNRPENLSPYCKRCHNEVHDISDNLTELGMLVRQYETIQRQRIAMGNRLIAYEKLGYENPVAHDIFNQFKELEVAIQKQFAKMLKDEPIYKHYLKPIKGIGPGIAAIIVSEIGDISRFASISALWAYCGLDVRDGEAPKRRKGEKSNWNQRLRRTCAKLMTDQFIKSKSSFGRKLYDQYKSFYVERDGEALSKGHVDNRARRKLAKVFLSCLWIAWRIMKELPISEPYAQSHLGHTHIVQPEEWAEGWSRADWIVKENSYRTLGTHETDASRNAHESHALVASQ